MIAKRVLAGLLAIGLILGAWVVRDRVIDDDGNAAATDDTDGNGNTDGGDPADVLVSASELREVCRQVEAAYPDLDVRVATAGATLDELATAESVEGMWLTFEPFPAMADTLRARAGAEPLEYTTTPVAGSPLAVVVRQDSTSSLVSACGDPIDLACLADQPTLKPTFAGLDTAVGTLGVVAAAEAFSGGNVDPEDLQFVIWGRRLATAGAQSLSGGTAIQTIQTRPTFAVAVGADAELAAAQRGSFDVLYPDPMTYVEVVLAVPTGVDPPDDFVDNLGTFLVEEGWGDPPPPDAPPPPDPGVTLAIRDIWEDLN